MRYWSGANAEIVEMDALVLERTRGPRFHLETSSGERMLAEAGHDVARLAHLIGAGERVLVRLDLSSASPGRIVHWYRGDAESPASAARPASDAQ